MKNSKNKVVAALVCGVIMGSIGTSFIVNFQSQEQNISNAQDEQNSSTSNNSNEGFYEGAFETVPQEIISSQSTDVDTVSGATFTSKGIINAVEDALQNASYDSNTSSSSSSV